jgi:type IV pilus assembly protein PilX
MKKIMQPIMAIPSYQRGAALIVSLLFLLILTVIGVTAVQVATLEEKMSSNLRAQSLAFQAAESALRAGEQAVNQIMAIPAPPLLCNAQGYYRMNDINCDGVPENTPIWQAVNWNTAQVINYNYPQSQTVVAAYIVEVVSSPSPTNAVGGSLDDTRYTSAGIPCYFRITARGTGGTFSATVILRSFFTVPAVDTNNLGKGVCNG